jgi:hypothetical protein
MKTIRQWLRSQWLTLCCLDIVIYPPLGRLGVWLCNRYEFRRYATRVEESIHATSGPFDAGGTFDIEFVDRTIPPRRARNNGNWLHSKKNLRRLIELAEKTDGPRTLALLGAEYALSPLRNDIPGKVAVERNSRIPYNRFVEVVSVSKQDYESISNIDVIKKYPPEKSSYLSALAIEHFAWGGYVFTLDTETSQEAAARHGN